MKAWYCFLKPVPGLMLGQVRLPTPPASEVPLHFISSLFSLLVVNGSILQLPWGEVKQKWRLFTTLQNWLSVNFSGKNSTWRPVRDRELLLKLITKWKNWSPVFKLSLTPTISCALGERGHGHEMHQDQDWCSLTLRPRGSRGHSESTRHVFQCVTAFSRGAWTPYFLSMLKTAINRKEL